MAGDDRGGVAEPTEAGTAGAPLRKARVLVVDDNPAVRALLSRQIASFGFEPLEAEGAGAALEALEGRLPDTVILDLGLPDGNGLEVLRKLKRDPRTADIPVLVLTGEDDREVALECIREGAEDFIRKPHHQEFLQARLDAAVRMRRRQAEAAAGTRQIEAYTLTLEEAHRRLLIMDEIRVSFLGLLAQRLPAPITILRTAEDMLRQEGLGDAERKELHAAVDDALRRLLRIGDDVLLLTKVSAGGPAMVPALSPHPLSAVLESAWAQAAPASPAGRATLGEHPRTSLRTPCEPELLSRALSSLLVAVLRESPPGTVLEATCGEDPRGIRLEIPLPGGAPAGFGGRRGDRVRAAKQPPHARLETGLGPRLAETLLRLMGGDLAVEEAPGGGERLVVHLRSA